MATGWVPPVGAGRVGGALAVAAPATGAAVSKAVAAALEGSVGARKLPFRAPYSMPAINKAAAMTSAAANTIGRERRLRLGITLFLQS